jgi:transcriptional regulator GlxA family with amidase domain
LLERTSLRYVKGMSETANPPRKIVLLALEGVEALDLVGPLSVFDAASAAAPGSYDVSVVSDRPMVTATSGLVLGAQPLPQDEVSAFDTLMVCGMGRAGLMAAIEDIKLVAWIRSAAKKSDRVASVCTGALLLAAAGLLKGRRATTHWLAFEHLRMIEPEVALDRHALYANDGEVWTSAGIASGIDLALAMVRCDLGPEIAIQVARHLVVPVVRSGTQSMFAAPTTIKHDSADRVSSILAFISDHLDGDLSTPLLAEAVNMTPRTFHRRCKQLFGVTPAQLVSEMRLDYARTALLNSSAPLKQVAAAVGFSDAASFSNAFQRFYGVSPDAFRKGFGVTD